MIDFEPLTWTRYFLSLAIIQQSVEFIQLRRTYDDYGVWRWKTLAPEIAPSSSGDPGSIVPKMLGSIFRYPNFLYLFYVQLLFAILLVFLPSLIVVGALLVSCVLVTVRWRGTFNGGSDYMTVLVLGALLVAYTFDGSPLVKLGCVVYIALQSMLSYTIAGISKLKSRAWRDGSALGEFLSTSVCSVPEQLISFLSGSIIGKFASWSLIIFEIIFPFAILSPKSAAIFLSLGSFFHLLNAYYLGLNRFVLVWLSTYPCILWCSQNLYLNGVR